MTQHECQGKKQCHALIRIAKNIGQQLQGARPPFNCTYMRLYRGNYIPGQHQNKQGEQADRQKRSPPAQRGCQKYAGRYAGNGSSRKGHHYPTYCSAPALKGYHVTYNSQNDCAQRPPKSPGHSSENEKYPVVRCKRTGNCRQCKTNVQPQQCFSAVEAVNIGSTK